MANHGGAALTQGARLSRVRRRAIPTRSNAARRRRLARPRQVLSGADPDAPGLLGETGVRHAAALRHGGGRRHISPGDDAAVSWAEAVEGGLCPALAPPQGWPLRPESQPPP